MQRILLSAAAAALLSGCGVPPEQRGATVLELIEAGTLAYVTAKADGIAAGVLTGVEGATAALRDAGLACRAVLETRDEIIPDDLRQSCGVVE